jgi:hypothetical protein
MRIANDLIFSATSLPLNTDVASATQWMGHAGGVAIQGQYAGVITPAANAVLVNQGLTYTAVTAGTAGNSITITLVDPGGNNQPLSIGVVGNAITANLATDSGGVITTTRTLLAAALQGSAPAAALVTVTGSGGTLVTALASTPLADGAASSQATVHGNFKIQVSCDPGQEQDRAEYPQVVNWDDFPSATAAVNAVSGTFFINASEVYAPWFRLVFDADGGGSGAGAVTARFNTKGF